ncbi:SDR family oxidoreductase [Emcibacter nanhaiensis]|uniref:SDR family oxidoreductase n=1 Tax=Emcibacter nanhaiensis TaxID=1505037 RepID=A0A501PGR5_9PROT|nr:SDR family oxidoreductase [Emcibacter nanhaiensis]TPD59267.1 SDR family oxidoreductase [Emcibacter nanhaiensis]
MGHLFNKDTFADKTVFVAGGTSGINLGIAEAFADSGANVAVLSRNQEKVAAAVDKLQSTGANALGFSADVRDMAALTEAFEAASGEFGSIDILVSGAAGNFPALVEDLSPNGFKAVVDIDLLGTFNVVKAAFGCLSKGGASIVNISAPQSQIAQGMQAHVCAAKAGIDHLTRCLAIEWGQYNIRVNAIQPGPIDGTEGMERLAPTPEARAAIESALPLGRYGTKREIADLAMFLSSDAARYITGAVIPCDGGLCAGRK